MTAPATTEKQLVKLVETERLVAVENMDKFNLFISQQPKPGWVVEDPKTKVKDIPIGRVEALLTVIFQDWYVEVLDSKPTFNSISVTVRLYYWHPVKNEWRHQDGVGSVGIQTKAGAAASDMNAINFDAVQKGLPAAKSYAIKDAADHIGPIFGRDINRKHTSTFAPMYTMSTGDKVLQRFAKAKTAKAVEKILSGMPVEDQKLYAEVAIERMQEINSNGSD